MILRIIFREIMFRRVRAGIFVLILASALALLTFVQTTSRASIRSMQIIMKTLGQNIVIIHEDTDLDMYYTVNGKSTLFDESDAARIAADTAVSANYYLASLERRVVLENGEQVILNGAKPYRGPGQRVNAKAPFKVVRKGEIRLGAEAAKRMAVGGETFEWETAV